MKKILTLMLAVAAALSMTACGQQPNAAEARPYTVEQVRILADAGVFSEELEELEGDIPFALYLLADYGLTLEDLEDCAALRSAGATCEEAAVLEFSDDEKAKLALTALEDYVQNQIDANVDYRPNEIPKLENAVVSRCGSTLVLVVADDVEKAKELLEIE